MTLRRFCQWVVAAAVLAPTIALADDCCPTPCAPTTCKVTCIEYVQEQVPVTRTTYRTECRDEAYTAYRCEMATEQRVVNRMVMRPVTETVNEVRTICESVPTTETRTYMKTVWRTVPVTTTQRVMVDRGHYESCQVRARRTILDRLCHRNTDCCPRMECRKVWVPCCVAEDRVVTCCQRVCEQVPCTYTVTCCRMVQRQVTVPVTRTRCECTTVQETVNVCVPRMVAVQCTRKVAVCVPVTETVMCCRMVPRTVEREVPAATTSCCSSSSCATTCCASSCCNTCSSGRKGLFHRNRGGCSSCGGCCN